MESLNNRTSEAKERISEWEDTTCKQKSQTEIWKRYWVKKAMQKWSDTIQRPSLRLRGIPGGDLKDISNEILSENFPNMGKKAEEDPK